MNTLLGLGGCTEEGLVEGVRFRLHRPPAALAEGGCPADSQPTPLAPEGGDPGALRLTYRVAGGGALLCDIVLPLAEPMPRIAIPLPAGEAALIDLHVERFDGGAALQGSGVARRLDLASAREVDVLVTPREQFACAAEHASAARAFHSATLLPTGEVLLVGGIVAGPSDSGQVIDFTVPGGGFYATDQVELYDPVRGVFRPLSAPALLPRAFHAAYLLGGEAGAPIRIALVGGFTVGGDATRVPALRVGADGDPFPLVPTAEAIAAATEILTYDPITATLTRELLAGAAAVTPRLLGAASVVAVGSSTPPLLAGGWQDAARSEPAADFQALAPTSGEAAQSGALVVPRYGATLTDLGDARALLWGGALEAGAPRQGELIDLVVGGAGPTSSLLPFAPGALAPAPRALHAAARAGDGAIIIAGGFSIANGSARATVEESFAERVTVGEPSTLTVLATAARPAGYLEAIALRGGDVLLAGGFPGESDPRCAASVDDVRCALADAQRYRHDQSVLEALPAGLLVGRYGQRLTELSDGLVLVTGGLAGDGLELRVIADAELFDSRTERDDPLADLAPAVLRAPGDIARDATGAAVAECLTVPR